MIQSYIRIHGKPWPYFKIQSQLDGSRRQIKMIDTQGGHYGIILETIKKEESDILFLETTEGELCS